ncbi:MAG: extracellular solute-binding protein [Bacillota bacterium]
MRQKTEKAGGAGNVSQGEQPFRIIHAGALRRPIEYCLELFCPRYTGLVVEITGAGSRECARRVLAGERYDVVALADQAIFAELLVPHLLEEYFVFATDQIVIGYNRSSRGSSNIDPDNWMDVLLSPGVTYARSDQNLDPCGYRTLMVWQLAEKFYGRPGLFAALQAGCPPHHVYPKSIDSAGALLEGKVDYAFLYASVARQLGFSYLVLPSKINLSNPARVDYYATAAVTVEGKVPGEHTTLRGQPIEFAVGVPLTALHPDLARAFIELLTGPEGHSILEKCGLIPC